MTIINMTPHNVNIYDDNMKIVRTYKSEGQIRCSVNREVIKYLDTVPVNKSKFGGIKDLPEQKDDTIYIVSRVVAEAMKEMGRNDFVIPDESVRDIDGNIVGCKAFSVL